MEWRADLESTCAALGSSDGVNYYKDDECIECVKDLIRFLRRDDASHLLRRSLGQIGVVNSDLIPLLRDYSSDEELFDLVLRLLVNLTGPELLLFREELPEDSVTRNHFIELQTHRQKYKKSFVEEKVWAVLAQSLGKLLKKEYGDRSEEDGLVIERILILIRNILQVPPDVRGEKRTDDEASLHDQILWVLHKSGIEDLLLFIASSDEETQYCLHVLEIISLMFREQDPKHLASANFQRSKEEKQQDEQELLKLRMRELEIQKQKFHQIKSSRHSRFGGTFTLSNVKSISDRNVIYHRPLTSMDNIDFQKEKKPKRVAKNKRVTSEDVKRRSTLAIRLFLKEFCVEFLHGAYNNLMSVVRDNLVRQRAQNNDETYYLWAMKFFMEFNRENKFKPELVIETLNKSTFHFIQSQIENYKDNFEMEKRNRPMMLIWARRMHLGIRAYKELLNNLVAMVSSKDDKVKQSGLVLRADVFYEAEYRELCLNQLNIYAPEKMSIGYITDLAQATHVFLKLTEHMSKAGHVMISSKKVKRKTNAKKKEAGGDAIPTQRESNEQIWDKISSQLSRILQGDEELPESSAPFDAASDIPIEDQKVHAMYRIHELLRQNESGPAVALLRASRQVWPEGDIFGPADAENEDEFMALREILLADIPKPAGLVDAAPAPAQEDEEEDNNILDREEIEDEDDDEEGGLVEFQRVEQEFDFSGYVQRFAVKSVCSAYSVLFKNFEKNTDYTNHCVIKMFHRIAFDLKLPALLYHFSILRTFQKIHKDYRLNPANPTMREMNKFAKHILQNFFENSKTNKHIWMESCFWKTSREAKEIAEGYGTQAASKKQKASFWCEEDEEKLTRVFHQLKQIQEEEKEPGGDLLDSITAFFEDSGRTRRQVARKLKEMALITDIREVTRKALKVRSAPWTEEEIEKLTKLYAEFKWAQDPINRIIDNMTIKRPKRRVVEKIMELGLCDDKKKLMKKRIRRGLKEGDQGYLQSASESDSALEDSSDDDEDLMEESPPSVELDSLAQKLREDESLKSGLNWLRGALSDEKTDRENDDEDAEDVPLVPLAEDLLAAIENPQFIRLLKAIGMSSPTDQEQYWRIPSHIKSDSLAAKVDFIEDITSGEGPIKDVDVLLVTGQTSFKKKKAEKRGPNKWMPMRRTVDADVAKRISEAAGVKEGETEKSSPKKKTPAKKQRKRVKQAVTNNDSSSEDEGVSKNSSQIMPSVDSDDSSSDNESPPASPVFNQRNKASGMKDSYASRSLNIDSDEDDKVQTTQSANSKSKRQRLDSSSSDDEKPNAGPVSSPSSRLQLESSSDEGVDDPIQEVPSPKPGLDSNSSDVDGPIEKVPSPKARLDSSSSDDGVDDPLPIKKIPSPKSRARLDSSSSDDGVDDPFPTKRVPSDCEDSILSRTRHSSSSSFSSSRSSSPVRFISMTETPEKPSLASSASNTPKRPRSSPSPAKSDKRPRKAQFLDSSDDE